MYKESAAVSNFSLVFSKFSKFSSVVASVLTGGRNSLNLSEVIVPVPVSVIAIPDRGYARACNANCPVARIGRAPSSDLTGGAPSELPVIVVASAPTGGRNS